MNYEVKDLLVPFYFGAISDDKRLLVERELLTDEEILVDFLDLKRELESAVAIPNQPSAKVWCRLQLHLKEQKRFYIPLGLAVAASLAILFSYLAITQVNAPKPASINGIIFDAPNELSSSSSVL